MTTYTSVFGGSPVQSSEVGYRAVTLSANTTLVWPDSNENTSDVVSKLMVVTASAGSLSLTMPPANQVSVGRDTVIRNIGSNTFTVLGTGGATIATLMAGQSWYIYVTDNSTAGGAWGVFQFGTGTSTADAASLAGYGILAQGSQLSQSSSVSTKNANYTITAGDRAGTLINTGGSITFSLTAASTLGSNWFCQIKNRGSGTLTIDPNSSETIDGSSTLALATNESCIVVCDGTSFYTVGYGRTLAQTAFTRLVKAITSSSVTLTSTEAGNVVQEYTGTLTANTVVIVPTTVARYYAYNATTSGGFTLTVKTTSGTGVVVADAGRKIIHCDGTNVVNSQDTGTGTVVQISTGAGLTGGPITTSGTVSLATTAVNAGSYKQANITVDAYGRLTASTDGVFQENAQTTDYTLVLSDAFKVVSMDAASAKVFTIPTNASVAFSVGTVVGLLQRGSGAVSVTSAGGVTLLSEGTKYKLYGQYAAGGLLKTGTNEWVLAGNRKT